MTVKELLLLADIATRVSIDEEAVMTKSEAIAQYGDREVKYYFIDNYRLNIALKY